MERKERETFPSTRWSLVGRAGHPDAAVQRAALTELLRRYQPALQAYLTQVRRFPTAQAEELLQGFLVSKVIEEQLVAQAQEGKGRFRNFLLAALNRYVVSAYRFEHREKRDVDRTAPLQEAADMPATAPRPEAGFDRAWAQELLAQAVSRMEAECRRTDRRDVWGVFEQRVLAEVRGEAGLAYDELVRRYGLKSPAHAANLLLTGKRMLARMLRAVVSDYEGDETRIDEELADLQRILAERP